MLYLILWLLVGFLSCTMSQRISDKSWRRVARDMWVIVWVLFPVWWLIILLETVGQRDKHWMQYFERDDNA